MQLPRQRPDKRSPESRCRWVSSDWLAMSRFAFLLDVLPEFFLFGEQLAMVFGVAVDRFDGFRQDESILSGFILGTPGVILQGAQFGLKLIVAFDDHLQRLAQVRLAGLEIIEVVVEFVVDSQK